MNHTKVEVIPESANPLFIQRETGMTHTSFHYEYQLFQCIKAGDARGVKLATTEYLNKGLVIGRLSANKINQMRYWAVSCISVAVHYAILGGLDETDAFNASDVYIRHIDTLFSYEDIIDYLSEKALDLSYLVFKAKADAAHSPAIRRCIHYIHLNLHTKITINDLARECSLSCDYLSRLFKQELKQGIHSYITKEKLEASKIMLSDGHRYSEVGYHFGFCSESHFISCFKKEYGLTPKEYITSLQN